MVMDLRGKKKARVEVINPRRPLAHPLYAFSVSTEKR
jgi:hypothetical protein